MQGELKKKFQEGKVRLTLDIVEHVSATGAEARAAIGDRSLAHIIWPIQKIQFQPTLWPELYIEPETTVSSILAWAVVQNTAIHG